MDRGAGPVPWDRGGAVTAEIPWATWPWNRCPARREDYARCDLRKGHTGDHLLERGIGGIWAWSTEFRVTLLDSDVS